MSRRRTSSSGALIEWHRLGLHVVAKVGTQKCAGVQVDFPAQKSSQFFLNRDEAQTDPAPGDEFDQQVNVAVWAEIAASSRTKEGKARDAVPSADLVKPHTINGLEWISHSLQCYRRSRGGLPMAAPWTHVHPSSAAVRSMNQNAPSEPTA